MNTMTKSLMSLGTPACGHLELISQPSGHAMWGGDVFIAAGYLRAEGEVSPQADARPATPATTKPAANGVTSRGPRAWSCPTT